jgi:hypothetical protein
VLLLYTFLSFGGKASRLDIMKILSLFLYTIFSIYFSVPTILASTNYLDLSGTGDFLRLASSILLVLAGYPLIYFLGKFLLKQDITIEEYRERKKKEEEQEKQEEKK